MVYGIWHVPKLKIFTPIVPKIVYPILPSVNHNGSSSSSVGFIVESDCVEKNKGYGVRKILNSLFDSVVNPVIIIHWKIFWMIIYFARVLMLALLIMIWMKIMFSCLIVILKLYFKKLSVIETCKKICLLEKTYLVVHQKIVSWGRNNKRNSFEV